MMVVFQWEGFRLESFRNYTSLSHNPSHSNTDICSLLKGIEEAPSPLVEDNPAWSHMIESIAANKDSKKQARKIKEVTLSMPLRRSVRFEEKGVPNQQ